MPPRNPEADQLQARLDRLEALHKVSRRVHSTLDLRESLQIILDEAIRLMRAAKQHCVRLVVRSQAPERVRL